MNTFGQAIKLSVFGESHGRSIGFVLDGLPAGTRVDETHIEEVMALRAPGKDMTSARKEADRVQLLSGVRNGYTVGGAVCGIIENTDAKSGDYAAFDGIPRPSHADFPAYMKYGAHYDHRGGGAFSGRLTAPICAAGAIAEGLLNDRGITVSAHVLSVGTVTDAPFDAMKDDAALCGRLGGEAFPVIDAAKKNEMLAAIKAAKDAGDSLGGVIECKITGMKAGVGQPPFYGAENALSQILYAIPAVKGVSFGDGFSLSEMRGSTANDGYSYGEDGHVRTLSNHAGGICGGLTTGMPILLRTAFKPTPSVAKAQRTVDLANRTDTLITVGGRHDPCIAARAAAAVRMAACIALLDLIMNERDVR